MNPEPSPQAATEADSISHILTRFRTVAVVGLSPKSHRDSYQVSRYMQQHGWRIVPINPLADNILGEPAYASLTEAARHEKIGLVNVFRNPDDVPPIVEEAIELGAQAVWLQKGISHAIAAARARSAGLWLVQDKCLMVEHARHAH
ncbi:MAG: CoA-binding protein [Rhodoferax sp.]|nr:CoA-binding protein [Rhodoferax sp.]